VTVTSHKVGFCILPRTRSTCCYAAPCGSHP
jgi:hypothetical protein